MTDTDPISYQVLGRGTPVLTSTGTEIGTVRHVLADESLDLFDGIVVATHEGIRFVDADQVGLITAGAVHTKLGDDEIADLPKPQVTAVSEADPEQGEGPGASAWFGRTFLREHWTREKKD